MTKHKIDPRVQRTRRLIMDAFIELSSQKEFRDITVKDITIEAMINRATFYYHFHDIYDLQEKALSEVLLIKLECNESYKLNEDLFINVFKAITNFQCALSNRCHRGYEDTIARIIREQLEVIFYTVLKKEHPTHDQEALKIASGMLSWAIYGASIKWKQQTTQTSEQYIQSIIPYLMRGIA
ncbi:TetR/AcrR family transcriptional regulator [Lentibacillus saliphilus]|uniref:TetR/AcrR family transcriptional regulator n=1 Tax=Lentibacillus saliphilus TaxID=2737028 RepID=UPI001C310761|nr:TetR/AcrR family transcriptional regulator [Lentibacillus saliphilus]